MANPKDPGTFDYWITDRIPFSVGTPKSGSTGGFDHWITDRIMFADYVEAAVVEEAIVNLLRGKVALRSRL